MKTFHLAVIGSGTFGENGNGVSFSYFFPHPFHTKFISFVYMEETCILNNFFQIPESSIPSDWLS